MKFILFLHFVAALLASCTVHAKVMAFSCAWEDGDIVFATDVAEDQSELVRRYDVDGTTYRIKITDLKSRVTHVTVTIGSERKIAVKPAKCLMESE